MGSIPGLKIPWRREWQPAPVFFPGQCHGQRSLEGYSPHHCRVRHHRRDWAHASVKVDTEVAFPTSSSLPPASLPPPFLPFFPAPHLLLSPCLIFLFSHCYCCSVAKSHPALCNPVDCSTPGSSVLHCLLELAQTHVHWRHPTISPSAPPSPLSSVFPAGSFLVSPLPSGGQGTGASVYLRSSQIFLWFAAEET